MSITGTLFLLAGTLYDPDRTDDMGAFGGLAARTPRFADLFAVAAFASLGLPSFSGFIAEFQIVSARSPRLRSRPRSPSSAS